MKNMFLLGISLVPILSNSAYAESYAGDLSVTRIHVANEICYIGTASSPADTCSTFSRQFKFSLQTNQGKAMYSIFIGAKLANKKVDIWYTPSTAPGTNETNGCNNTTIAVATQAGLSI